MKSVLRLSVALALAGAALASPAQDATFTSRSLTTETALAAANAALQSCRKQGYQVAVAVVDRAGLVQALLRDRFAGAHTVDVAANKAWTAASFRTPTTDLAPRNATRHADERHQGIATRHRRRRWTGDRGRGQHAGRHRGVWRAGR
jgi:putative hemolysin